MSSNSHNFWLTKNPLINDTGVELLVRSNRGVTSASRVGYKKYVAQTVQLQEGGWLAMISQQSKAWLMLSGKTAITILLIVLAIGGVSAEAFLPAQYKPSEIIKELTRWFDTQEIENEVDSELAPVLELQSDPEPQVDPAEEGEVEEVPSEDQPEERPEVDAINSQPETTPPAQQTTEPATLSPATFEWSKYNHGPTSKTLVQHPYFPGFSFQPPAGWTVETRTVPNSQFSGFQNYAFIMRKQDITVVLYARPGYVGTPFTYGQFLDQGSGWGYTNPQSVGDSLQKANVSKVTHTPTVGEQTVIYGGTQVGSVLVQSASFSFEGPEINVNSNTNTYRMFISVNQAGATPFLNASQQQFTYQDNTISTDHPLIPEIDSLIRSINYCRYYSYGLGCNQT